MTDTATAKESVWQKIVGIILLCLMGFSFFFAQSNLWVNNVIFNQQSFTTRTTAVLTSQQSRDAIAQSVTEKIFEDRPVADRILGERATTFISSLLGSDLSEATISRVVDKTYAYITSRDRQDIAINLSSIRDPLSNIIGFAESRGRSVNFDANKIPEQIVLVSSNELPNLSQYIRLIILGGGLLWVMAISTACGYIFLTRKSRVHRLYITLGVLASVTVLILFSGPFIPPAIASLVNAIPMRGVASALALTFIEPFGQQLILTLALLGVAGLAVRFRWVFVITWQQIKNIAQSKKPKGSN